MKKQLELFPNEELQPQGSISISEPQPIEDVEWCFQFFNNEPTVFAYSVEGEKAVPLVFQIESVETQGLIFSQNGMEFKIFPRPISEASKLDRANPKKNEI